MEVSVKIDVPLAVEFYCITINLSFVNVNYAVFYSKLCLRTVKTFFFRQGEVEKIKNTENYGNI